MNKQKQVLLAGIRDLPISALGVRAYSRQDHPVTHIPNCKEEAAGISLADLDSMKQDCAK